MLLDDPVLNLFRFHQKARAKTADAMELASAGAFGPQERATCEAITWFLCGPLSWHDLDEEASVNRRLRHRAAQKPDVIRALDRVRDQHDMLEDAADTLVLAMERAEKGDDVRPAAKVFQRLLLAHLSEEERAIFPAARALLTVDDLAEIGGEIAGREQRRKTHRPAAVEIRALAQAS